MTILTAARPGISLPGRITRGIVVGLAIGVIMLLTVSGDLFFSLRMQLNDTYFIPRPHSDRIVIVAIDDASLNRFGRSLAAWPRTLYAEAVDQLAGADARVIAFDVLFAETDTEFRDSALQQALEQARGSEARTRLIMPAVGLTPNIPASGDGFLVYNTMLLPLPGFREVVDYVAFVNVLPDSDNVIRRQISRVGTPSMTNETVAGDAETGEILYGFSIAAYLAYLRVPSTVADQIVVTGDAGLGVGPNVTLPVDSNGIWRQNFFRSMQDSQTSAFEVISFADAVDGRFDPALIADRIVLIGVANSTGSGDRYPVPFARDGRLVSGVEIHAHAIETLLQNQAVRTQPLPGALLTFTLLALGFSLVYTVARWYVLVPLALIGALAWLLICSLLFDRERVIIDVLYGGLAIVLPAIVHLLWKARDERVLRRRSELSLAVVEAILDGSPGAVLVLDAARRVRRVNRAFRQQITPTISMGQPIASALAALPIDDSARTSLLAALEDERPFKLDINLAERAFTVEGASIQTPDGSRDWVILINDVTTLTDLNRLRTQMIRMTSHDIRNPLNNILGFAELLHDAPGVDPNPTTVKEFLGYIITSAHDIKRILEGVLNLEKARTGKLTRESVSMARIIEEVTDQLRPRANNVHQTLTVTLTDPRLGVRGDSFQLTQAIFNLVENAVKYTRDGGQIAVRGRKDAGTVIIEIEDNGYGIPAEAQSGIFKEFFRAVRGESANIRGTGLGLSLVKTIVDVHGGTVTFTSVEGQGTTFTVKLPAFESTPIPEKEPAHA